MRRTCLAAETADFLRGYEAGASDSEAGRHAKRPPHPDDVPALPQDIFNLEKRSRRSERALLVAAEAERDGFKARMELEVAERLAAEAEVEKLREQRNGATDLAITYKNRAARTEQAEAERDRLAGALRAIQHHDEHYSPEHSGKFRVTVRDITRAALEAKGEVDERV